MAWVVLYHLHRRPDGLNFTGHSLPSSKFVAITAVPEPSALVLTAIGAGFTAWAARRRHCLGTGQDHG